MFVRNGCKSTAAVERRRPSVTCVVAAVVAIGDANVSVRVIVKVKVVVVRRQFTVLVPTEIRSVVVVFESGRAGTRGVVRVRTLR